MDNYQSFNQNAHLSEAKISLANKFLFSLFSNPDFLNWLKEYHTKIDPVLLEKGDLDSLKRKFVFDLNIAFIRFGDKSLISQNLRYRVGNDFETKIHKGEEFFLGLESVLAVTHVIFFGEIVAVVSLAAALIFVFLIGRGPTTALNVEGTGINLGAITPNNLRAIATFLLDSNNWSKKAEKNSFGLFNGKGNRKGYLPSLIGPAGAHRIDSKGWPDTKTNVNYMYI